MKTAVVYYSLGGATRSFARAEAKSRDADLLQAVPVKPYRLPSAFLRGCPDAIRQKSVPLQNDLHLAGYDRIVLMAPVWAGFPAPPFNTMVSLLPPGKEVEVLLVSASGHSAKSHDKVRALIAAKGCTVVDLRDIRSHQ